MKKPKYRIAHKKRYGERGRVEHEWYQIEQRCRFLFFTWWATWDKEYISFNDAKTVRDMKENGHPMDVIRTEEYYYGEDSDEKISDS